MFWDELAGSLLLILLASGEFLLRGSVGRGVMKVGMV